MTKFGESNLGLAPELPNFCTSSLLLCPRLKCGTQKASSSVKSLGGSAFL